MKTSKSNESIELHLWPTVAHENSELLCQTWSALSLINLTISFSSVFSTKSTIGDHIISVGLDGLLVGSLGRTISSHIFNSIWLPPWQLPTIAKNRLICRVKRTRCDSNEPLNADCKNICLKKKILKKKRYSNWCEFWTRFWNFSLRWFSKETFLVHKLRDKSKQIGKWLKITKLVLASYGITWN